MKYLDPLRQGRRRFACGSPASDVGDCVGLDAVIEQAALHEDVLLGIAHKIVADLPIHKEEIEPALGKVGHGVAPKKRPAQFRQLVLEPSVRALLAGAHHQLVAVQPSQDHGPHGLRRFLAVGGHGHHAVPGRLDIARQQGRYLAEIARVRHQGVPVRPGVLESPHAVPGSVGCGVVDQDELVADLVCKRIQDLGNIVARGLDAALVLVDRDDNGDEGKHGGSPGYRLSGWARQVMRCAIRAGHNLSHLSVSGKVAKGGRARGRPGQIRRARRASTQRAISSGLMSGWIGTEMVSRK